MRLATDWVFDGERWKPAPLVIADNNIATPFVNPFASKDCHLEDCADGDGRICVHLIDCHKIAATLFLPGDLGYGEYHYQLGDASIRWGSSPGLGDPQPCHRHQVGVCRLVFLDRLRLHPWQEEYDILALGVFPETELTFGEWSCHLETCRGQGISPGKVRGPKENPEVFLRHVELFMNVTYGRIISIPWLGLPSDRFATQGYRLHDPVYVRSVEPARDLRFYQDRHMMYKTFADRMRAQDPDRELSTYFDGFYRALISDVDLQYHMREWLNLLSSAGSAPILVHAFSIFQEILARRDPNFQRMSDEDLRKRNKYLHTLGLEASETWDIPDVVAEWIESVDWNSKHPEPKTWYDSYRVLRNKVAHRAYEDITWDLLRAVSAMSYDVIDRIGDVIWNQLQGTVIASSEQQND